MRRRLRVILQREVLDRELAEGADPRSDAALRLRAQQLCRQRTRRALAHRLRRTVDAARRSAPRWGFRPLAREHILAESDALADLARRLEAPGPVEPRGVALARLLVTDPLSPLRVRSEPAALYLNVRLATVALDAPGRPSNDAPRS